MVFFCGTLYAHLPTGTPLSPFRLSGMPWPVSISTVLSAIQLLTRGPPASTVAVSSVIASKVPSHPQLRVPVLPISILINAGVSRSAYSQARCSPQPVYVFKDSSSRFGQQFCTRLPLRVFFIIFALFMSNFLLWHENPFLPRNISKMHYTSWVFPHRRVSWSFQLFFGIQGPI